MKKKRLNAISLFSGAMGLDLGLEKAGIDIRLCVEMNKYAVSTIRQNKDIPVIDRDITTVSSSELLKTSGLNHNELDLLVGGPPCQAFSTAGARRGLNDFRGNVIIQYLRIVSELQPKYFILENVRGILSAKLNSIPSIYTEYEAIKNLSGSVIRFLANEFKKQGYTISFALFNSANYGVPQIRERVIIFGHRGTKRIPLPQPTHSELGLHGTQKWLTLGDVIADLPQPTEAEYKPLNKKTQEYINLIAEGENWTSLKPEIAQKAMGKAYYLGGGKTGFLRRLSNKRPSPTLVTSPLMPATLICHPTESRPLSIKEYARIQQFPDYWTFSGSISEIYKQIGNAVPVGLGYIAGNQIVKFENGELIGNEDENNLIPYSRYKNTTDKDIDLSPPSKQLFDLN